MKLGLAILFVSMAMFAASGRRVNVKPVQYFNAIGEVGTYWTTQTVVRLRSGTFDGPPVPTLGLDATNKVVETVVSKFTVCRFRYGTNILSATITNTTVTMQQFNRKTAKDKWMVSK